MADKKKAKSNAVHVSGKRKRAIARATAKPGKGNVKVNNKFLEVYQPELLRLRISHGWLILY